MGRRVSVALCILASIIFMPGCTVIQPYPDLIDAELEHTEHPTNIDVALVLSAGGSKSLAHVGVLKVLHENNIPIDLIVGASAGAIVGAMYADNLDPDQIRDTLFSLKHSDILDFSYSSTVRAFWGLNGFYEGQRLKFFLESQFKDRQLESLNIPVAVVATQIKNNSHFVMHNGQIAPALLASSAIPSFFPPVNIYKKTLVDGGVISPVPVEVAKEYNPKLIIAVNVGSPPDCGMVNNTAGLVYRSAHIMYYTLSVWQTDQADVVIEPDMMGVGMFDDDNIKKLYQEGVNAANDALPMIKDKLEKIRLAKSLDVPLTKYRL